MNSLCRPRGGWRFQQAGQGASTTTCRVLAEIRTLCLVALRSGNMAYLDRTQSVRQAVA